MRLLAYYRLCRLRKDADGFQGREHMMEDWRYWATIVGAALLKVLMSSTLTFFQAVLSFALGVFTAWVFTEPFIDWVGLNPVVYMTPTAAILALTGEQIVRRIIRYANRPGDLHKDIKTWKNLD